MRHKNEYEKPQAIRLTRKTTQLHNYKIIQYLVMFFSVCKKFLFLGFK